MKVLMLGWEYPPHISGGLGTACEGLTKALATLNIGVDFVLPHLVGDEQAPHMNLLDSSRGVILTSGGESSIKDTLEPDSIIEHFRIPAFLAPYWNEQAFHEHIEKLKNLGDNMLQTLLPEELIPVAFDKSDAKKFQGYGGDLFGEVERYAGNVVQLVAKRNFDVIHAHDWITFPAATALAKISGKPLIVHVHSLESDRAGFGGDHRVKAIEKMGLDAASQIIAVSHYTASLIAKEHGIPRERIKVVHNGLYPKELVSMYKDESNWQGRIVLFLGRVTFQKGPEYFVEAAAKVIPYVPDVMFVMAGSGDMLPRMVQRVNELDIGKHFRFTGFLRGKEVEEMFSIADLYVMPSVSEPFGLSALEAINFETPVIISRQSGVAEVLAHALKVDFWDVDRMADLIINCLLHREIGEDMVKMAREEVKRLRWEAAAIKMRDIYQEVI
jgi:glycosyltransferase involved in cell wall biosynthesis